MHTSAWESYSSSWRYRLTRGQTPDTALQSQDEDFPLPPAESLSQWRICSSTEGRPRPNSEEKCALSPDWVRVVVRVPNKGWQHLHLRSHLDYLTHTCPGFFPVCVIVHWMVHGRECVHLIREGSSWIILLPPDNRTHRANNQKALSSPTRGKTAWCNAMWISGDGNKFYWFFFDCVASFVCA